MAADSFGEEAGADGEAAVWDSEGSNSDEELAAVGTNASKRAYERALKSFRDLAREVSLRDDRPAIGEGESEGEGEVPYTPGMVGMHL